MKTILKTIVTLIITAMVPVAEFFIVSCFAGLLLLLASMGSGTALGKPGDNIFTDIFWWVFISIALPLSIAIGHAFLLGLPALLLGWYFRAIHWWSTLIAAFIIGAIPSTIYVIFFQDVGGWSESTYLWQDINIVSLGAVAIIATTMVFFGLSAGLAFWPLWRYWVLPSSSAGRPSSLLSQVETQSLGANE